MLGMGRESEIAVPFAGFRASVEKRIDQLSAEKMINESAINPFMVKSLGLNDFDSIARYYVYQRISRSMVTSFGTRMEKMVKIVIDGEKKGWWDVVKRTDTANYYVSVKSGPRSMNKDQTKEFARQAAEVMKNDPKARPFIAMGYGKRAWPVITRTLDEEELDPERHVYVGKALYELLGGEGEYYHKVLDLVPKADPGNTQGKTVLEMIDDKVKEISEEFSENYKTVDKLLLDTF